MRKSRSSAFTGAALILCGCCRKIPTSIRSSSICARIRSRSRGWGLACCGCARKAANTLQGEDKGEGNQSPSPTSLSHRGRGGKNGCSCAARRESDLGKCHALLALILPAAILIRSLADLVALDEDHLRHAFVGVDFRGQRRGVGEFERDVPFPFGFERSYVHYYSTIRDEDTGFEREVARLGDR